MAKQNGNMLVGMKEIRQALNDVGEYTVIKWHREYDMPIKKKGGIWVGSRTAIEKWWKEFVDE